MWLETKAVGGFLNEPRIFHNMYVLGNLLSKYIDVRTLRTYRVTIIEHFFLFSHQKEEIKVFFITIKFVCSKKATFEKSIPISLNVSK